MEGEVFNMNRSSKPILEIGFVSRNWIGIEIAADSADSRMQGKLLMVPSTQFFLCPEIRVIRG
jgi:hypothetical protein